jgi:hypothetical protein
MPSNERTARLETALRNAAKAHTEANEQVLQLRQENARLVDAVNSQRVMINAQNLQCC